MTEKRQPAPEPPEALVRQLKAGKVVPFIGAGFSKSARPKCVTEGFVGMPTYAELLAQLSARAGYRRPKDREIVEDYLQSSDDEAPDRYDRAAELIRLAMGEVPFFLTIREILEPIDQNIEGSLAHQFLGLLGFRRIVTTNYDRFLERFSCRGYEVITPRDEQAFHLFTHDPRRRFVFKLHGDITRPDTIPWGRSKLLDYYGYDPFGNPKGELPNQTKELRTFLEELFRDNSILFLGTSLAASEGFAQVLLRLVRDWGGSLPQRHYVLVPADESLRALRQQIARDMNLHYLYYTPDAQHSQIWEFLSFLKAGRPLDPPRPGQEWEQWYNQKERPDYLSAQLGLEKTATSARYLTPKLTNALAPPGFLEIDCRRELAGRYSAETIDRTIEVMKLRAANLERRLREEHLEVRILFLEAELYRSLEPAEAGEALGRAVERYRHLLELCTTTDLEVRVLPELTSEECQRQESSFGLIFNKSGASLVDIALAYSSQANNDFPEVHRVHINTPEVWKATFTFERLWAAARSEQETRELIVRLVAAAVPG